MAREIPYEIFKPWKIAYKNCNEKASSRFKDFYDNEFLDKIVDLYVEMLKGKTQADYKNLIVFFETVISYCKYYLKNTKKWSKAPFVNPPREQAVKNLQKASEDVINGLAKYKKDAEQKYTMDRFSQVSINICKGVKCIPFVLDIPYAGIGFTTIRCYVLVKGSGMLKSINGEFNPAKHELVTGEKYTDKSFDSRKIYKVSSIPIKLPLGIGSVTIDVLISPNGFIASTALNLVSFDHEIISPSEL